MTASRDWPLYTVLVLLGIQALAAMTIGIDSSFFVAMIASGFLLVSLVGLRIEKLIRDRWTDD